MSHVNQESLVPPLDITGPAPLYETMVQFADTMAQRSEVGMPNLYPSVVRAEGALACSGGIYVQYNDTITPGTRQVDSFKSSLFEQIRRDASTTVMPHHSEESLSSVDQETGLAMLRAMGSFMRSVRHAWVYNNPSVEHVLFLSERAVRFTPNGDRLARADQLKDLASENESTTVRVIEDHKLAKALGSTNTPVIETIAPIGSDKTYLWRPSRETDPKKYINNADVAAEVTDPETQRVIDNIIDRLDDLALQPGPTRDRLRTLADVAINPYYR